MGQPGDRPFERLVRERTGADFVERRWLTEGIESALASEPCRFVLVTGEPGAGKTSVVSGLAKDNPGWLRYFVAQPDSGVHTTGDVTSFLLSVGHQFARRYPDAFDVKRLEIVVRQQIDRVEAGGGAVGIKISDLTVSPFQRTATLAVEQRAGRVAGSLAGVEIGTAQLEPRLLAPANLAHLALVAPAEVLLERDPGARIVILLDALDDATRAGDGLLDWLSSGVLPPNVRVVVTSRPTSSLGRLRTGRAGQLTEIAVDPADRRIGADLVAYAGNVLATPDIDRAVRAEGLLPDQFHRRVVEHASGNFQYLASYARALADAIAESTDELITRLLRLDSFPAGLSGIYALFAELARRDIEQLGMLDIKEPRGDADTVTPAWEGTGQPILGVLTVAREPLSVEALTRLSGVRVWPRSVRNVLSRLRWLLDVRDDRVAFFHQSIADFLLSDRAATECPDCRVDEAEWHERIVRHYRGSAGSWAEVDWSRVDRYGLAHLADHVARAAPPELVHLVCPGLSRAIRQAFGTDQRFLELVDRAAAHVTRTGDVAGALADVMYLGVVRHHASTAGDSLPPEALGLLARRGRLREALDRATAMPPSARQFASMLEILRHARPGAADPPPDDLVELLVDAAVAFGASAGDKDGRSRTDSPWIAMKTAALVLAPRDIDRALRLWEHGKRTAGGPWAVHDEHPDALLRASARAQADIGRAGTLIARMRTNRADGYLELAERADPGRIAGVLTNAETALAGLKPARRLRELARLAAAWTPHDPATAARLLAELRAAAFEAITDKEKFAEHVAEAAAAVRAADDETARMLLAALDTAVVDGWSTSGFLRGVELWRRWGEPDRAAALARRLVAWNRDAEGWTDLRVLTASDTVDPAEKLRLIDRIHAAIPEAHEVRGGMESGRRDRSLVRLARELAAFDADRAAEAARGIARIGWVGPLDVRHEHGTDGIPELHKDTNPDRYSALAEVAHRCVDNDDEPAADRLLTEIMRGTANTAPLGAGRPDHTAYLRATDPVPEENEGKARGYRMTPVDPIGEPKSIRQYALEGVMVTYNLSQDWSARAKRYFYRDPADLVRAVSFGPYTLARTVRVFAEHCARDRAHATAMVRTIADTGERAIGFAGLHLAAHTPDHGPEAEALSQELDRTLAGLETYRWSVDLDDQDAHAWAYLRPDHRVRFEVAVRALGCRPQDYDALEELGFLGHTMARSLYLWISRNYYAPDVIAGRRPHPSYVHAQEELLAGNDGDPVSDIAQAQAACEELRIRRARPGHRSPPWGRIRDPVYAAVLDLARPEPGAALSPAFVAAVTDLIEEGGLPAAAGLVTFAAQTRPECAPDLRRLGEKIVAATATSTPAGRVETLARLTGAQALTGLVDPAAVCQEAERCPADGWEYWVPADAQAQVFPALLAESPAVALHKLYEAVATRWEFAMRLLESAVEPLTAAFGGDPAGALASGVRRGLACAATDGRVPTIVDGVRIEELAQT